MSEIHLALVDEARIVIQFMKNGYETMDQMFPKMYVLNAIVASQITLTIMSES